MFGEKMRAQQERTAITDVQQQKVKNIKMRFYLEALSFASVTVGFALALYRTHLSYQQAKADIQTVE
jgi:hypothetical protein